MTVELKDSFKIPSYNNENGMEIYLFQDSIK